ncbi:hypothetical protein GGF32_002958 [Allomyces javanicus]|nr:hypothetical protein GGF32_002958 [Allomyces javanicus]
MSGHTESPFADLTSHIFPPPEFCIVGGGVAGLTMAALFERARIPYVVLEKREHDTHLEGADVALYPTAIQVLVEMGISDSFWPGFSTPVKRVHICRANELASTSAPPDVARHAGSAPAFGPNQYANPVHHELRATLLGQSVAADLPTAPLSPAQAAIHTLTVPTPMKSLSMDNILGENQIMRLTNRRALMRELQRLVPREKILFGASTIALNEHPSHVEVMFTYQSAFASISVPVVIGADGVRSVCRHLVQKMPGGMARPPRYTGEICFRGSFAFGINENDSPTIAALKAQMADLLIKEDWQKPNSTSLYFGDNRRSSWGFLNEAGTAAYWWVRESYSGSRDEFAELKRKRDDKPEWPEPLRSMYMLTDTPDFYVQPIVDRETDKSASEWYSTRCVLIGDSAHPATPELFQGANLAIEDAALLCSMITRSPPSKPPRQVFAEFAERRIKHVSRIQKLSFRQSKLAQVKSKPSVLLRDTALKLIPTRFMESKLRKTTAMSTEDLIDMTSAASISSGSSMRRFGDGLSSTFVDSASRTSASARRPSSAGSRSDSGGTYKLLYVDYSQEDARSTAASSATTLPLGSPHPVPAMGMGLGLGLGPAVAVEGSNVSPFPSPTSSASRGTLGSVSRHMTASALATAASANAAMHPPPPHMQGSPQSDGVSTRSNPLLSPSMSTLRSETAVVPPRPWCGSGGEELPARVSGVSNGRASSLHLVDEDATSDSISVVSVALPSHPAALSVHF